jgi:hypothetical protein
MGNNKDWRGDSNSIYKTLGASNHTDKERQNEDFYATEPKASELLLKIEDFSNIQCVWDNSCGNGTLLKPFEDSKKFKILATDLIDRGYGKGGIDFLKLTKDDVKGWGFDAIVMNPPYSFAKNFVEHSIELLPPHGKLFAFLKLQFLEGKGRKDLFKRYPPEKVWVSSSRLLCAKNAEFEKMIEGGGSAVAYCWFVFNSQSHYDNFGTDIKTILKWFN